MAAAAIALDADVFIRLRHQGLTQALLVDDVRIGRGLDLLGPRVASQAPTNISSTGGPLNQISVTFDEPIDSSTLTTDDVRVWDPNGAAIAVVSIGGGVQSSGGPVSNRYFISFADQTKRGVYRFSVGPDVSDLAGNLMNQDGDIHAGDPSDAYEGTVNFEGVALALPVGAGALYMEGFESWPPAGDHWSFSANSGGMVGVGSTMPRSGSQHLFFDSMNPDVAQYAVLKVDLSALATATGLTLDFWGKRIGSTIGRFCVDVSGDGTTWTEVFCERSESVFKNHIVDLDKALRDAGVAFDADVYIRFRHFSLIQDFVLDDVQISRAAKIASIQPGMGGVQLGILTKLGLSYRVDRSEDLINWTTVDTVAGNGGIVTVLDATATQVNLRFYRFVEIQPTE